MATPRYLWRQLLPREREKILAARIKAGVPWHGPPHLEGEGDCDYHVTAACYQHAPVIGLSPERMNAFASDLREVFAENGSHTAAWCVLPNHYHALVQTSDVRGLLHALGGLHGRSSFAWNGEEQTRGRTVFHRAAERFLRGERHFWATVNYIHHNPVRHAYAERWTDWPWSSAAGYLAAVGRAEAERIWRDFPVLDYGDGWDAPQL